MIVPVLFVGALVSASAGSFFDLDMRNAFAATLANEEWRRAKREGKGKLLVCRDVDVGYDGVQVLFGVDFDVEEGEIIALLGTNGAGKSTLLRAISGTQEASAGAIVFDGRDITHMPPHEIAARGVIHMPGGRGVFPGLTVRENLLLGNWMTEDDDEVRARLTETFAMFPILHERADEMAQSLSGGEQQMLSLAQAFLGKPRLLMIDELSLGLSPAVVGQLLEIVREIHARGVTIIVVEQSVNVALTLAERAIFMEKGEVKFFGDTADLLARPDILRAVYVKGTGALTDGAPASARRRASARANSSSARARHPRGRRHREALRRRRRPRRRELRRSGGRGARHHRPQRLGQDHAVRRHQRLPDRRRRHRSLRGRRHHRPGSGGARPPQAVRRFQDARLFPSLTVFETLLVALDQRLEVKSVPQRRPAAQRPPGRTPLPGAGRAAHRAARPRAPTATSSSRSCRPACAASSTSPACWPPSPRCCCSTSRRRASPRPRPKASAPLLRRVRFETGCSILIIEHDMPLISAVSDELIALDRGQVVLRGTPEEVLNDERVIESYLGGSEETVRRSGSLV